MNSYFLNLVIDKFTYSDSIIYCCITKHPKFSGLKPPHFIISHDSVCWVGNFSAGLVWSYPRSPHSHVWELGTGCGLSFSLLMISSLVVPWIFFHGSETFQAFQDGDNTVARPHRTQPWRLLIVPATSSQAQQVLGRGPVQISGRGNRLHLLMGGVVKSHCIRAQGWRGLLCHLVTPWVFISHLIKCKYFSVYKG